MQEKQTPRKSKTKNPVPRIGIVDTESGEVLIGGQMIYVPVRQKIKGFFMANQIGLELLATKTNLTGEAFRVLMFMMSRMDYENAIRIPQKDIAEALDMKKQNVSRAVKALRDAGVIDHQEASTLYLSTFYGWKGKVVNKHKHEDKLDRIEKERQAACPDEALIPCMPTQEAEAGRAM